MKAKLTALERELLDALTELQGAVGGFMLSRGDRRDYWHHRLKNDVAERVQAAIAKAENAA